MQAIIDGLNSLADKPPASFPELCEKHYGKSPDEIEMEGILGGIQAAAKSRQARSPSPTTANPARK